MLAANTDLELRPPFAATLDADAHQFAHTVAIDGDEGVAGKDAARHVRAEKARGVVAADAVGGLRQVVGAEGKERRALGDLARAQRGARQLDHRADLIVDLAPPLARDRVRHGVDALLDQIQFGFGGNERDNNLPNDLFATSLTALSPRLATPPPILHDVLS